MATDKQIEANRQNAQKSTGPKTDEGKEQSRANSLKHGLAGAGIVNTREDDADYAQKLELYREHVGPGDELEEDLVRNMAMASTRLERCRRQELAGVAGRKRKVFRSWQERRVKEFNEVWDQLGEGVAPAVIIGKAERMGIGCENMDGLWAELDDTLQRDGRWTDDDFETAVILLGRRVGGHYEGDAVVLGLLDHHKASQPGAGDEQTRAQALTALRTFVAERRERLEKLRIAAWQGLEGLWLAEQLDAVQFDTSDKGMRLLRYASAADQALHRNLNRLIKLRLGEPEHLSVKKWVKMGKQLTRIWNGLMWVPSPDKDGQASTPGWGQAAPAEVAEAEVRNEANSETEDPVVKELKRLADVEERLRAEIARGCADWPPADQGAANAVKTGQIVLPGLAKPAG
jgi:hypothetical protein